MLLGIVLGVLKDLLCRRINTAMKTHPRHSVSTLDVKEHNTDTRVLGPMRSCSQYLAVGQTEHVECSVLGAEYKVDKRANS